MVAGNLERVQQTISVRIIWQMIGGKPEYCKKVPMILRVTWFSPIDQNLLAFGQGLQPFLGHEVGRSQNVAPPNKGFRVEVGH